MILSRKLGDGAYVLVDLGHHPLGTNIEQIVAILVDEGKLGDSILTIKSMQMMILLLAL